MYQSTDPEYKYAEALLIVFNKYSTNNSIAIEFNYKDLYELITGKDSGKSFLPEDSSDIDEEVTLSLIEAVASYEKDKKEKEIEALKFMVRVQNVLKLITLCELHNRELLIKELEDDTWIAIDLKNINVTKISF